MPETTNSIKNTMQTIPTTAASTNKPAANGLIFTYIFGNSVISLLQEKGIVNETNL
jgi:hypothetical protein